MQAKARRTGFACKKPEFSRFFLKKKWTPVASKQKLAANGVAVKQPEFFVFFEEKMRTRRRQSPMHVLKNVRQ
jgi:hypothetical protein